MVILTFHRKLLRLSNMILIDGNRNPKSGLKYNTKQSLRSAYSSMEEGARETMRVDLATELARQYKLVYPKTQAKTLQGLRFLLFTLIKTSKPIALTMTPYCNVKTLKNIVGRLAEIFPLILEARSGVSKMEEGIVVFQSSPTIQFRILATEHLFKHWEDHIINNKGKQLDLLTYDPEDYERNYKIIRGE